MPLKSGNVWRYGNKSAFGRNYVSTFTVQKPNPGASKLTAVESVSPAESITWRYDTSSNSLLLKTEEHSKDKILNITYDPPYPYIPSGLKTGEHWSYSYKSPLAGTIKETTSVYGPESVAVPAGKFKVWKFVTVCDSGGMVATKTRWYAPSIGLVQYTFEGGWKTSLAQLIDYRLAGQRANNRKR